MSSTDLNSERVLILAKAAHTAQRLGTMLAASNLAYHSCSDAGELQREITAGAGTAILVEGALTPVVIPTLVESLAGQDAWSDFPLIILSERTIGNSGDAYLRMLDLLEPLGNVTVLQRPVTPIGVVSAVRTALRARRRQYQVRDLIQQQQEAVRKQNRFLSLLAHEVRNPLGVIRNASSFLMEIGRKSLIAHEQLQTIARQSSRLGALIANTLDFFNLLAGRGKLHRETVDVVELVRRCLRPLNGEAEARNLSLSFSCACQSLIVDGDPQRLEQAVTHLLHNALETTASGGRVALVVQADGDAALIAIRGGGVGLPAAALTRCFVPLDATDEPLADGLRLGLALTASLAELHGGSVHAAGAENGGVEVRLRLPLRTALPAPPSPPTGQRPGGATARQVLVIEDNDDGRESLRLLLQIWGHQVVVAPDGAQGIEKALARHPEVGLVDIGLPGMDGYQVARHLRAALGDTVYLIAMTGYGQPHDRQRALEAGFDSFLVKPVVPETLQDILIAPREERKL